MYLTSSWHLLQSSRKELDLYKEKSREILATTAFGNTADKRFFCKIGFFFYSSSIDKHYGTHTTTEMITSMIDKDFLHDL